ncbi:ocs element-binding factor 1 [Hibiscus syriacus]|uniref:Vacuolar protein sorting-associated protein 51 homolog n=1 Tax=Hibiscus syriacus TaxID=106335 RepID=A0A6A2WSM1_HIBSY|nr:ocs element-binding factor 1 [Hibiscus syriacus]
MSLPFLQNGDSLLLPMAALLFQENFVVKVIPRRCNSLVDYLAKLAMGYVGVLNSGLVGLEGRASYLFPMGFVKLVGVLFFLFLDALLRVHVNPKEAAEEHPLQDALEASKKAVLQGSMDVLPKDFRALYARLLLLSGKKSSSSPDKGLREGAHAEKVLAGIVLGIAASFSGGGGRGYENGPAFVPGVICRIFRSAVYKYENSKGINSAKRFTTPNWIKHKEPREVHMFVDLFLQELKETASEVKQILPQGLTHKHRRSDSNGSTASSRSNQLRDEKMTRSNTQRARSQLLETNLAKLFEQKVEIFTKVEHTQESVVTTTVKLCLKSLHEFVRLQTFNPSGFQQIQLDIQFLRTPLKETVEDELAVDFLLDEVIVAASERCLDPIPLEPPILDRLIQAKLAKWKEQDLITT